MRLFIAIRLSDEIRSGLAEIQSLLRNRGVSGNFTKLENLHLTLAFIGEYADPEGVLDAIRGVPFAPFSIRLDGFGSFGRRSYLENRHRLHSFCRYSVSPRQWQNLRQLFHCRHER